MSEPPRFTVHSRARSFVFAFHGWRRFIATQHNAWVHAAATVPVIAASILLGISAADWRWIVLAIALVWITEALNTAIEQLGDAITTQREPRIGFAKDIAAGAVLVGAIAAAAIGALTLAPYFIAML